MITAAETLPNLLHATASLIRMEHGPGCCPDFGAWRRAADLLDRVAVAEESGTGLMAGERAEALRVARAYLGAEERVEASA